ncbi:hypothetical protein N7470_000445 [Penicillium chermesinum]|nr:hypothetical protein N7470_000445 [Penicillium chermesinum]
MDLLQDAWQPPTIRPQCLVSYDLAEPHPTDMIQGRVVSHMNGANDECYHSLWLSPADEVHLSPDFELSVARARAQPPKPLSEILASRLQYSIDVFRDAPRMMIMENQTPWCHPQLYKNKMPKVMQDAYSCCSMYLSKNEINAPVIMNLTDAKINELLSTTHPTTLPEILARVHALILYQIMRLFDGDVLFHRSTDTLFPELENSIFTLMPFLHLPRPSDSVYPLPVSMESISEFWKSWILQESARRTVLITFFFTRIYKTLRGTRDMQCDGTLGLEHAWYLSSHLWSSQSAFDFAVAWAEKPHFVVENLNFSWVLGNAQPDDVDQFGKMLLVTLLGIDGAKAWFYARNAIL